MVDLSPTPGVAPIPEGQGPERRSVFLKRLPIIIIGVGLLIVAGWYGYRVWDTSRYSYVIPGVPTLNIYDEEMLNGPYVGATNAALLSILRYWGDDISLDDAAFKKDADRIFAGKGINLDQMIKLLGERGYTVKSFYASNLADLKAYINPQNPVPLLTAQMVTADNLKVTSPTVVVGLNFNFAGPRIIMSDYLHGQNYSLSFSEFQHLWDLFPSSTAKYRYIAIYPTDPARVAARVAKNASAPAYPPRTEPMDMLVPLLPEYVSMERIKAMKNTPDSNLKEYGFLKTMTDSELFSYFHPAIQARMWSERGLMELKLDKRSIALDSINKGIALDQNLDAPFSGWGRSHFKQISSPYFVLYTYYKTAGDAAKAATALGQRDAINAANASSTPSVGPSKTQ